MSRDHNQLVMEVLKWVASHNLIPLFHEKPYANINGSGKHVTGRRDSNGENLLEPGDAPEKISASSIFCWRRQGDHDGICPAMAVASAGNDFALALTRRPGS